MIKAGEGLARWLFRHFNRGTGRGCGRDRGTKCGGARTLAVPPGSPSGILRGDMSGTCQRFGVKRAVAAEGRRGSLVESWFISESGGRTGAGGKLPPVVDLRIIAGSAGDEGSNRRDSCIGGVG
jgi:hypothetical protein